MAYSVSRGHAALFPNEIMAGEVERGLEPLLHVSGFALAKALVH